VLISFILLEAKYSIYKWRRKGWLYFK